MLKKVISSAVSVIPHPRIAMIKRDSSTDLTALCAGKAFSGTANGATPSNVVTVINQ